MPITQKRVYEVTLPNKLVNLMNLDEYTVNTLRDYRQELLDFANEMTDMLGVYQKPTETKRVAIGNNKTSTMKMSGTPEQRNQILSYLKSGKSAINSKEAGELLGIHQFPASTVLSTMWNMKILNRRQDPNTKFRQYIYELPPSSIDVLTSSVM